MSMSYSCKSVSLYAHQEKQAMGWGHDMKHKILHKYIQLYDILTAFFQHTC